MKEKFAIASLVAFYYLLGWYGWAELVKGSVDIFSYLKWLVGLSCMVALFPFALAKRRNSKMARLMYQQYYTLKLQAVNLKEEAEQDVKEQEKRVSFWLKEILKFEVKIQKILDNSYNYKVKTLLSGVTLKNKHTKFDQLMSEKEKYLKFIEQYISKTNDEFYLTDNSHWDDVVSRFHERVFDLEKAQEVKEEQAELKRQMREEKQRQDELERRQREAKEEELRLAEQQRLIEEALLAAEGQYKEELERQRFELEQQIQDVHSQYERAKSMAQLTKQGHVYVISNVGSFGENVFKIGMTRRLEPIERVKELGDASVPFEFDIHAMISCDDAPALESALHNELDHFRVNKVNRRKEFFSVSIQTIIESVERNHGTVEYVVDPIALQYYQSLEFA
ncbi:GIY-YIG nuclease family protein [Vibrio parahaemolyticus]|nr:GIY-YIG nuclease family protein [Vibrio parahaemolyticus]